MASGRSSAHWAGQGGVLVRLARDVRGNAAAVMAMMLIPLLLFVGSAVDVSRVYTVKARLQQACDAGVLAGKRAMTTTDGTLDTYAAGQAVAYFKSNFHYNDALDSNGKATLAAQGAAGWMQTVPAPDGTTGKYLAVFTPKATSDGQVSGTAVIQVPMAVMRMFGFKPIVLTATCEARNDTTDADIMFVLDVTGSMACLTSDDNETTCKSYVGNSLVSNGDGTYSIAEKDNSRIDGLRAEVLNFYDNMTKLKDSTGGYADLATNFRFGFVPYNSVANVGKLLQPLGYMKTTASYDTRTIVDSNSGSASSWTETTGPCTSVTTTRSPAAGSYNKDSSNNYYATVTTIAPYGGKCYKSTQKVVPGSWLYSYKDVDTSGYVAGGSVTNPAQYDGTKSTWAGCVEERQPDSSIPSNGLTTFSMTNPPNDMDPDDAPTGAADSWAPWWPDITFPRLSTPTESTTDNSRTFWHRPQNGNGTLNGGIGIVFNEVACPLYAKRLSETTLPANTNLTARATARATVRTNISNYLNLIKPYGTTYHDVGMMWGLRLISPTGIFKNDTQAWTGHAAPNRFIIFITDGDIETDPNRIKVAVKGGTANGPYGDGMVYSEYGMETFQQRVGTNKTGDALDTLHSNRFLAACQLAKNRNITVFVIAYAQALTTDLTTCASPDDAYTAASQSDLNKTLTTIAAKMSLLRISR